MVNSVGFMGVMWFLFHVLQLLLIRCAHDELGLLFSKMIKEECREGIQNVDLDPSS